MEIEELKKILRGVLSADKEIRASAETIINELQNKNYQSFIAAFLQILSEDSTDAAVQHAAGLILKNTLHSTDAATQNSFENRWLQFDKKLRDAIKNHLIFLMNSQKMRTAFLAANVLSNIARIELPRYDFLSFFSYFDGLLDGNKEVLNRAVLECVGTTCSFLITETSFDFIHQAKYIFSICLKKMRKEESIELRLASLKCTDLCLEAFESVVENKSNLNELINCVTQMCSETEDELTTLAMQTIYRIVGSYYKYLKDSFEKLRDFIKIFMNSNSEKIQMEVLEFFTVLAEVELCMEGVFVQKFLDKILIYVLNRLYRNDEQLEDGWNSHKAASICLEKISILLETDLINHTVFLSFLDTSLQKSETEIAFIALGSAINKRLNNPERLKSIVPYIIQHCGNENLQKSAFFALTRISKSNFSIFQNENLQNLILTTNNSLAEKSQNSIYAAHLLAAICEYVSHGRDISWKHENCLSNFFPTLIKTTIDAIESVDYQDFKLRTAIFTALNELINCASPQCAELYLGYVLEYLIQKSEDCLKNSNNHRAFLVIEDFLSNLISSIQITFNVVNEQKVPQYLPKILNILINSLQVNPCGLYGDVYVALSSLCKPNSFFTANINLFINFIIRDLKSNDVYVLKGCINFVGDMANILSKGFMAYSNEIVPVLIQCLLSNQVTPLVKPILLSAFGDVSLSLGNSFLPFVEMTMQIAFQISTLQRKFNESFVDSVRKHFLQMFDCVVITLGYNEQINHNLQNIFNFIKIIINEDEQGVCTVEVINILTDLFTVYSESLGFEKQYIVSYVKQFLSSKKRDISEASRNAMEILQFV